MKLTFYGAAESVTGSRFLLETGRSKILIDCGLFQGLKRLRRRNWDPFPVRPESIDAVVLTHAHIDHSGYLPALCRDGFTGPIWCSAPTRDLATLMLRDSAHLQEEDARYAGRHRTSRHDQPLPLYTIKDANRAVEQLRPHGFDSWFEPATGVRVSLRRAGHILGAASVLVEAEGKRVFFTGDVGRPDDPVMLAPSRPPRSDVLVTESTYGRRLHPPGDPRAELGEIVNRTVSRGGSLLIPSFAVGRAQSILHLLAELRASGEIPDVPIYLNSPMAIDATELMLSHRREHHLSAAECARLREGVRFMRTTDESKDLMTLNGPMIVVSASGMATGGRILHHLLKMAPDHRNTVLFVGFQAAGTRGDSMVGGCDQVKIFGRYVRVRAEVARLEGLSAHADCAELISWLGSGDLNPERTFVVHGEPAAADAFRRELTDHLRWAAEVPEIGESFEI